MTNTSKQTDNREAVMQPPDVIVNPGAHYAASTRTFQSIKGQILV